MVQDHTRYQPFLKAIASEWKQLVPKGTVQVINSVSEQSSDVIKTIYLSLHEYAQRPNNFYPHIHIFLTSTPPYNYKFTVSCARGNHFLNKKISSSSFSPTEYCAYFQQLLKTHCMGDAAPSSSIWAPSGCTHVAIALLVILLFIYLKIMPQKHQRLLLIILSLLLLLLLLLSLILQGTLFVPRAAKKILNKNHVSLI